MSNIRDENGFLIDTPQCCGQDMECRGSGIDTDDMPFERFICSNCGEEQEY